MIFPRITFRSCGRRALALAALLGFAATASAQEPVEWPLRWAQGETWTYDSEALYERRNDLLQSAIRAIWQDEMRIDSAGDEGYTQIWRTRNGRIDTVTGDRSYADAIAPALEQLEQTPLTLQLDPSAKFKRIRNFENLQQAIRKAMEPAMRQAVEGAMAQGQARLTPPQREALRRGLEAEMQSGLDTLTGRETLQNSLAEPSRLFNRFMGERFEPGREARKRERLISPTYSVPLQGVMRYTLELPKDTPADPLAKYPDLARVRWTTDLLTDVDPAGQWALAEELYPGKIPPAARKGRPQGLKMQQRGWAVFRREDGKILFFEADTEASFGQHMQREQRRMRATDAGIEWSALDADKAPPKPSKPAKKKAR